MGRARDRTGCHTPPLATHHWQFEPDELTVVQCVRLIRKLAPVLNGVDLSRVQVGDEFLVSEAVAAMLIREGWAELVPDKPTTAN